MANTLTRKLKQLILFFSKVDKVTPTVSTSTQSNETNHRTKKDAIKITEPPKISTTKDEKRQSKSEPNNFVHSPVDMVDKETKKETTAVETSETEKVGLENTKDGNNCESVIENKGHKSWTQSMHSVQNQLKHAETVQTVGATVAFFFPLIAGIFIYWQFRAIEAALGKAKGAVFQGANLILQMVFSKIRQLF
ncbi:hypothetical protein J3Q64DRAFT_1861526 [Phycomyces blakesleeanus]|uniref:Uncharacterized protein n=2 Tax=Phycomyces blakesleeanus TaxID=4837 RepID=A0A162UMV3_PHYB8|nr:hypothetical protein PHYBLDRAFT_68087 [Phycomyces blakesleeanus NRRL 1555(-)]OAD77102.1 hypothetical protein PHYBLDRAFT_68087 [Phycomyces blakesleeanus NRRL 1555(-)]|eukprot:XP_018295142.1 hypothetical protein PHYBLDRAFT_68087 [Phycomyces blakesleeanus NRRL 1555(-)]